MVETISSLQNKLIKDTAKLSEKKYRHQAGLFLLEGIKLVQEVLNSTWLIEYVFIDKQLPVSPDLLAQLQQKSKQVYYVTAEIISKISDVQTAQGIVAVARIQEYNLADCSLPNQALVLVLENIQDPGNMGTIIRTAVATGVSSIIVTHDCVDIYSPKVVRASMGGILRIPVVTLGIVQALDYLRNHEFAVCTTALKNAQSLYSTNLTGKTAIVLGNEANGVSEYALAHSSQLVFIPQIGQIESLNVSIAASVIMYESLRQKLHLFPEAINPQ